jgi:hypothetical protein
MGGQVMLSRFFGMALVASSAALPLSITTARCLADATYQEGTFNDADWSITSQGVGNGGSASGAQVTSGGNPDDYRHVSLTVNPAPGGSSTYSVELAAHLNSGSVYSPATQGAAGSMSISMDAILLQGSGDGLGEGIALQQDGQIYYSADNLGHGLYITPDFSWTNHQLTGLHAADFFTAADWPYATVGAKPDFSSSGHSITLGFYTSGATNGGSYTESGGVDNWALTVSPVPEPGCMVILCCALGLAMVRKRKG